MKYLLYDDLGENHERIIAQELATLAGMNEEEPLDIEYIKDVSTLAKPKEESAENNSEQPNANGERILILIVDMDNEIRDPWLKKETDARFAANQNIAFAFSANPDIVSVWAYRALDPAKAANPDEFEADPDNPKDDPSDKFTRQQAVDWAKRIAFTIRVSDKRLTRLTAMIDHGVDKHHLMERVEEGPSKGLIKVVRMNSDGSQEEALARSSELASEAISEPTALKVIMLPLIAQCDAFDGFALANTIKDGEEVEINIEKM